MVGHVTMQNKIKVEKWKWIAGNSRFEIDPVITCKYLRYTISNYYANHRK